MDNDELLVSAIYQLFDEAKDMYGDIIENYWFYDRETCPGCGSELDTLKFGDEDALSLNAYMYRDLNTLIAYLLCSNCASEIFRKSKKSKTIYPKIEENLKNSYLEFVKKSSS